MPGIYFFSGCYSTIIIFYILIYLLKLAIINSLYLSLVMASLQINDIKDNGGILCTYYIYYIYIYIYIWGKIHNNSIINKELTFPQI